MTNPLPVDRDTCTQVAVMERDTGLRILTDEEVDAVVKEVDDFAMS